MSLRIKPSNCPSRSRVLRPGRAFKAQQRGYALLIMMMMVTVLLVALTAALPSVYTEGQREREEELIFRGNEYRRAIGLFRRRFSRFPFSVEELLRTNGIRFLRRAYPDPMTRNGKWRFIHANAGGALLDSRSQGFPGQAPSAQNASSDSKEQSNGPLEQKNGSSSFFNAGRQSSPFQGTSGGTSVFSPPGEIQGAFIAGVVSTSHRQSIRVLNRRKHYDEWEFIGVELNTLPFAAQPGAPAQPGQTGQTGLTGQPVMPPSQGPPMPSPSPPSEPAPPQ